MSFFASVQSFICWFRLFRLFGILSFDCLSLTLATLRCNLTDRPVGKLGINSELESPYPVRHLSLMSLREGRSSEFPMKIEMHNMLATRPQ